MYRDTPSGTPIDIPIDNRREGVLREGVSVERLRERLRERLLEGLRERLLEGLRDSL